MSIACVVLNYNDSATVVDLVNKICSYETLDYVVVVDNCSTDGSWNALQALASSNVHVIRSTRNGGYGAGNNFGIRYAQMELGVDRVLIANPDVYFSDACVRRIDRIMTENPDAAVVAPTQLVNGSPLVWRLPTDLQDVLSASLFISKCFRRFMPYYPAGWFAGKSKVEVDAVAGSLLLVDVRKMDAVGMYDERVFLFYEELLLGWKFKTAGWKTLLAVDESYDHFHSVSIKKSYKSLVSQKKLLLRSKLYFIRAYRSFSPLALLFTRAFFQLTLAEIWVLSVARTLAKR